MSQTNLHEDICKIPSSAVEHGASSKHSFSNRAKIVDVDSYNTDKLLPEVTISSKFKDLHAEKTKNSVGILKVVEKSGSVSSNSCPESAAVISHRSSSAIRNFKCKNATYVCRSSDSLLSSWNSHTNDHSDVEVPTSHVNKSKLVSSQQMISSQPWNSEKSAYYVHDAPHSSKYHVLARNFKSSMPSHNISSDRKGVLVCNPCTKSDASFRETFKSEIMWIKLEKPSSRKKSHQIITKAESLNLAATRQKSNNSASERGLSHDQTFSRAVPTSHRASDYGQAVRPYHAEKGPSIKDLFLRDRSSSDENSNRVYQCRQLKDQDITLSPEDTSSSGVFKQPARFSVTTSGETFDNEQSFFSAYDSTTPSPDQNLAAVALSLHDDGPDIAYQLKRRYEPECDGANLGRVVKDINSTLIKEASFARRKYHRRCMSSMRKTIRTARRVDNIEHSKSLVAAGAKESRNHYFSSWDYYSYSKEKMDSTADFDASNNNCSQNYVATTEEDEPEMITYSEKSSSQTLSGNSITKITVAEFSKGSCNYDVDTCTEDVQDNNSPVSSETFELANLRITSPTISGNKSLRCRTKAQRQKTCKVRLPTGLRGKVKESTPEVLLSQNPHRDFRRSMISMIMEKDLNTAADLEELLQCYLSLNAPSFSHVIVQAFSEIWTQIFGSASCCSS